MSTLIFGPTTTTLEQCRQWMRNRGAHQRFIDVAPIYYELAPIYEIPAENAIGQASWETNDGKYTGQVPPEYRNWCGLKTAHATGDKPEDHQQFPDDRRGIRAHLQHLRRYGGRGMPPGETLVDPRWHLVTKFTDTMEGLGGAWAPSATYGNRVVGRINVLKQTEAVMAAQIPGFKWQGADADHYDKGRPGLITGAAQHYSGGTNSLGWLTKTSVPPVSAHALIKHNPTMEDRGWQLVRIEDTAWTTGHPTNDFVVAVEYEHTGDGPIPDIAYEVMAQTWVDIAEYVEKNNLGQIVPATLKGHNEWVGDGRKCPDGIDVPRIRGRMMTINIIDADIEFENGYTLTGAFAGMYRLAEQSGVHWSAIGIPIGPMKEARVDDQAVLVVETDVGWMMHTPATGETRMAKPDQRAQIEGVPAGVDRGVLDQIMSKAAEIISLGKAA